MMKFWISNNILKLIDFGFIDTSTKYLAEFGYFYVILII